MAQPDGSFERLLLHPKDYGFPHEDVPLDDEEEYLDQLGEVLAGKPHPLTESAYLEWRLLPVALWEFVIPWNRALLPHESCFWKGA